MRGSRTIVRIGITGKVNEPNRGDRSWLPFSRGYREIPYNRQRLPKVPPPDQPMSLVSTTKRHLRMPGGEPVVDEPKKNGTCDRSPLPGSRKPMRRALPAIGPVRLTLGDRSPFNDVGVCYRRERTPVIVGGHRSFESQTRSEYQ